MEKNPSQSHDPSSNLSKKYLTLNLNSEVSVVPKQVFGGIFSVKITVKFQALCFIAGPI